MNDLRQINTMIWKHTDFAQRGRINEIEDALTIAGGHVLSTDAGSCDVLEAALTGGRRAMIIDGDYSIVDYIPHTPLTTLGYRMFRWNGEQVNPDNPELANQKLIFIPPGRAGEQFLKTVGKFA